MPSENSENRKVSSLKPLAALFPYLTRHRLQLTLAAFFLFLAAATTLTLPVAVRRVIDRGFSETDSELVNSYFAMLLVIALVLAISSSLRYFFVIWLGERVVADLRRDVFSNVTRLSSEFFDTAKTGEIISRLTADTTQIKSAMGATASLALRNALLGIGAVIMMIYTSPRLSTFVLAAIPLIVFPIIAFGRAVRRRSRHAQDTLAEATAYASESIGAVQTMQSFSNETQVKISFANAVDFAFDAAAKAIRTRSMLTGFAIFLIFSSVVGVLWIGANDVLTGSMTAGTLSQFLLYAVFAAGALAALSEVWGELSQAAGSAERLIELLETKPAILPPDNPLQLPSEINGDINFDQVTFAYPTRPEEQVLKEFSLAVKSGETVAIVGQSGAGKSTLLTLLLRFYDPDKGAIKLDGYNIRDLDPEAFRKHIAYVPQETTIFATSASDNISYGSPRASQSDVIEAAKAANAHEFIEALPAGYDTQLGERGVTLSGGQRQRMAIARAILKDAPILLLDEATSALDGQSEKLVQDALEKLMQNRTTLIVAHRLATILKADRIIVMDQGTIAEEGTHKSLQKRSGIYAELAKLQFSQV